MSWTIGTLPALNWMMIGGWIPGGRIRSTVFETELICAIAAPMSVPGWKNTRIIPTPGIDCDSIRSIPLTVVEKLRSLMMTTRRSISSADRPG